MKEKKGIKYLLYNKSKKGNSYKIFLCEKIFDDKEIYHGEQMEVAEKIQIMKAIKRKVPSDYEKEKKEREEEENKNLKKRKKKDKK